MLRLPPGPLLTVTTLEGQEGELTGGPGHRGTWDVSPPDEDPDSRRACPHVCAQNATQVSLACALLWPLWPPPLVVQKLLGWGWGLACGTLCGLMSSL